MNRLQDVVEQVTSWLLAVGDAHLLVLAVADERARRAEPAPEVTRGP